jgi:hypothetical protein
MTTTAVKAATGMATGWDGREAVAAPMTVMIATPVSVVIAVEGPYEVTAAPTAVITAARVVIIDAVIIADIGGAATVTIAAGAARGQWQDYAQYRGAAP